MNTSTRRGRLLSIAALFVSLVITTGWASPTPQRSYLTGASSGRVLDDLRPFQRVEGLTTSIRGGSPTRDDHPRRTFAAQVAKTATPKAQSVHATPRTYSGRNHFWIPSLGISQHVYWYSCGRTSTPANLIYRWGCGGTNNVYILGHAYGVMKPLHDAYVAGRLHVGMLAIYADGKGNIRSYRVTAWKVVRPTVVAWATASQPVPSMTLQTCIGARSQWRLDVRLVAVD